MKRNWKTLMRDDVRPQWAGMYVTMNGRGTIVMNRATYEKLGEPTGFMVLYDGPNNTIGLKPTAKGVRNAYPVANSGKHGGRKVSAYRLISEVCLNIAETLEFPDAEIDLDGILILNLRTAKISRRALNHPRRQRRET